MGSAVSVAPQFTDNKAVQEKGHIIHDCKQQSHMKAHICKVDVK